MKKIPLYIVTGFLGSGKTTLLKNVINEYSEKYKIGIVENEFAPLGVDSISLKRIDKPFDIIEVNNGSVFCVCLLNDFISSLSAFIEAKSPDLIILEASGLSDPVTIGELMESPLLSNKTYLAKIISIVDANNFLKLKNNRRIIHQIRVADQVIINKTDLLSGDPIEIINQVRTINPYATLFQTSFCEINLQELLKDFDYNSSKRSYEQWFEKPSDRPDIDVKVLKVGRKFNVETVYSFFSKLEKDVYRVKGFILTDDNSCIAIQYTLGQLIIDRVPDYTGNSILISMGINNSVTSLYKDLLKIAA